MRLVVAGCLCISLISASALAQAPSNSAEALFRAGREATKRGDTKLACEHFNASYELQKAAGTQLNLALCEEDLGHAVRAWTLHDDLEGKLAANDPRRSIIEEHKRVLELSVARLTLQLADTAPAQTVATDAATGKLLFQQRAVALAPGEYVIAVVAPGHTRRDYPLQLKAAEVRTLVIEPGAADPKPAGPPPTPAIPEPPRGNEQSPALIGDARNEPEPGISRATWGGIALGVGGAAWLTSGVAGLLVLQQKDVVERECSPGVSGRVCTPKGLDAGERGRLYSDIGTVAFAVGVVGAGLGAYLLLSDDVAVSAEAGTSSSITLTGKF